VEADEIRVRGSTEPLNEGERTMTTVFIVADVRMHRRGYEVLLKGSKTIRILGTSTREDAPEHVAAERPDVVLLDVTTAGQPAVIKTILGSSPRAKVIVMGVEDDERVILSWIERGASGYVTRQDAETDLLSAIADVATGDLRCPPRISRRLLERVYELAAKDGMDPALHLTEREKEIARFLAQGLSNKEIARTLSIEPSTVKNHVHNILEKTHEHRRAKAAARLE
jgi:two-component system, NarL family, nitrate/nitrite response regulator NarL